MILCYSLREDALHFELDLASVFLSSSLRVYQCVTWGPQRTVCDNLRGKRNGSRGFDYKYRSRGTCFVSCEGRPNAVMSLGHGLSCDL